MAKKSKTTKSKTTRKPAATKKTKALTKAQISTMIDALMSGDTMDVDKLKALPDTPEAKKIRQAAFLAAYAVTLNVTTSAEVAGICRRTPYIWLADETDEDFQAGYQMARVEWGCRLEAKTAELAIEGATEFVLYQGEPVKHPVTDELLIKRTFNAAREFFLLKGMFPDRYAERSKVETNAVVSRDEAIREAEEMLGSLGGS